MFVGKPVKGAPCKQEMWTTLLRHHTGWQAPSTYQRDERRRHAQRSPLRAFAWLGVPRSEGSADKEYGWWCPVLNASQTGMSVQSPRPIPKGTQVSIQLSFGDKIYSLTGTVASCAGTSPKLILGIGLIF